MCVCPLPFGSSVVWPLCRVMGAEASQAAPSFEATLDYCRRLSEADQKRLVDTLAANSFRVRLQAWCDGYDGPATELLPHSSPPPLASSFPVSPWCPDGRSDRTACKEAAVTGCPWCRRPVIIVGSNVEEEVDEPLMSANAYVALLYGPSCHEYFLGALVLGHGLRLHARG